MLANPEAFSDALIEGQVNKLIMGPAQEVTSGHLSDLAAFR